MKYQRKANVESAPMTDETLLYEPTSVKFCALNDTGSFLWSRLETPRTVRELMHDLSTAYRLENEAQVEQDLQQFLDQFVGLSFVAADAAPNGSTGATTASPSSKTQLTYGPPRIRVMDESEVLTSFQITSAGISWWVM